MKMDKLRALLLLAFLSISAWANAQVTTYTYWKQLGPTLYGVDTFDQFGTAVALDGDRMVASAPRNEGALQEAGQVQVYEWDGVVWQPLGSPIEGILPFGYIGQEVAISGDLVAVGSPAVRYSAFPIFKGEVRVYEWNGSTWNPLGGHIVGQNSNSRLGAALALQGTRLIVGDPNANGPVIGGTRTGGATVYDWTGTTWITVGTPFYGGRFGDAFGREVALDGNRVAISAVGYDQQQGAGLSDVGHVSVYEWDGSVWNRLGNPMEGQFKGEALGLSLELEGNRLVVGSSTHTPSDTLAGAVRVYEWDGTAWNPLGQRIDGEYPHDYSFEVELEGDVLAIGGSGYDPVRCINCGYVRFFEWNGAAWQLRGTPLYSNPMNRGYGRALSLSGQRLALGLPDIGEPSPGRAQVFEYVPRSVEAQQLTHCGPYEWRGQRYAVSGQYSDTLTNSSGGDSITQLQLTVNMVDVAVSVSETTLMANASNAQYQWLDCDDNNAAFPNETNATFTPATLMGRYAVVVTQQGCVDTSVCYLFRNSLAEVDLYPFPIQYYPNPTQDEVTIDFGGRYACVTLSIYDAVGQLIEERTYTHEQAVQLSLRDWPAGLYLFEVTLNRQAPVPFKVYKQ